MRKQRDLIGFDDRWFIAIGVLVIGFMMPFLFFARTLNDPFWSYLIPSWGTSYLMTLLYWFGSRKIIILFRRRYPNLAQTGRRVVSQTLTILAYAITIDLVLGSTVLCMILPEDQPTISGLAGTYLIILFIEAVYESFWLYDQWHRSIVEKERLKQEHVQSQLEGLRNQVNPHFLFNSLNTLLGVIEEDPGAAKKYVQHLSNVFRYVLENRNDQLTTLKEELAFIQDYVFLQQERFREALNVDIHVPEEVQRKMIVPLSLQLLFENAVKHNVISSRRPLEIRVTVLEDSLIVQNNLQRREQTMPSTKVGLANIRDRYRFFTDHPVEVEDGPDFFTVTLPIL